VLPRGECLGLVGPNGSGKSTLLRIAAGVEPASGGEVRVLGHPAGSLEARRRTGYLAEASTFPGELSGRQVLDLLGSLSGMPRRERRTRGAELLERVGLAAAGRRALGRYSKGMLRRFGLAQAFLHRPELVLLDEPTAGLDAPGYPVLEDLLAEARAGGASIVLCSHVLSDVVTHGDRLAVLIDGRIVAAGAPLEIAGASGRLQVELEGLDEAAGEALERFVTERGGRVVSRGPGAPALLEIYRRLAPGGEDRRGGG
jgi:ABC-2 type transport system ATP-binding protein